MLLQESGYFQKVAMFPMVRGLQGLVHMEQSAA